MMAPPDWSARETRFLVRYAGKRPLAWIAGSLGRGEADVTGECARLGLDASFPFEWCAECSSWRHFITPDHATRNLRFRRDYRVCLLCRIERITSDTEARTAEVLSFAPPDVSEKYADTEAQRIHTTVKRDAPPRRGEYRTEAEYLIASEEYALKIAKRRMKRTQKRYERICRAVAKARDPCKGAASETGKNPFLRRYAGKGAKAQS